LDFTIFTMSAEYPPPDGTKTRARAAAAKLSSAVVGGIAAKLGNVAPQE